MKEIWIVCAKEIIDSLRDYRSCLPVCSGHCLAH